jgi:hypothetical protein
MSVPTAIDFAGVADLSIQEVMADRILAGYSWRYILSVGIPFNFCRFNNTCSIGFLLKLAMNTGKSTTCSQTRPNGSDGFWGAATVYG